MKWRRSRLIAAAFVLSAGSMARASEPPPPVKIIFDTDMWGDIDDALALAVLHALQDRREVAILAITISTEDQWIPPYIDAVDTFYRHGNIPIGMVRHGVTAKDVERLFPQTADMTNYTQYISELRAPGGALMFPRALSNRSKVPEAVTLLRETLAAQPDASVVIVQVGFSTNLARLLESRPDAASALNGRELVKRKVRLLSVMAGRYADRDGKPLAQPEPEWNLIFDIPSAKRLFAEWPTPMVVSGFEIGKSMLFKGTDIDRKFGYVRNHPIALTYRHADPLFRTKDTPAGELHNRSTFDLTSVLYAARPDDNYFSLSEPGTIAIQPDGSSRFTPDKDGRQRYFLMNDLQRARALEAMTMLASEPPATDRSGRPTARLP
jgi:inosine-uridine nucleoside N-ribohydrolase